MERRRIIRILGTLFLILAMASLLDSCKSRKPHDALNGMGTPLSPAAQDSMATAAGGDSQVRQWPAGVPPEVPRFPYGTISKVIRTETPEGTSWDMAIDGVPPHALRDYEATLKSSGFSTSSLVVPDSEGERGSVTGEKGRVSVVLIGSGSGVSLSIIQKFQ